MPTLSREQRLHRAKRKRQRLTESRLGHRRHAKRLRANGFIPMTVWVPSRVSDLISEKAAPLKVPKQRVLFAALEVGMKHLTHSDIQRAFNEWRSLVERPGLRWKEILDRVHRRQRAMKEAA